MALMGYCRTSITCPVCGEVYMGIVEDGFMRLCRFCTMKCDPRRGRILDGEQPCSMKCLSRAVWLEYVERKN